MGFKVVKNTAIRKAFILGGVSIIFFNKASYPVVYVVPPDIDMYMHQTNDTYKVLIQNLCGAGNNGQGIIKDCFNSLSAYLQSSSSYTFTPLANPNINTLSKTIGGAVITSSTITNSTITSSTITFSSITNSNIDTVSTTYCFPIGSSQTCFSIADYTTMQYQTILLTATYQNGQITNTSSGTVWMPSCTYNSSKSLVYAPTGAEFIAFAPTSCSYDFSNPGSQNNVVGPKTQCPPGDTANTCYTISATCFFGNASSTNSSTVSGVYYTNLPVLSFCPTWSES